MSASLGTPLSPISAEQPKPVLLSSPDPDKFSSTIARVFLGLAAANCALQIAWFWRYTAHNINFDAISYIGIAHHLLDGDFRASLNGYWSPFLSWCIAAAGAFTHNLLLAARLVTIASFLACLPLLYLLTLRLWRSASVAAFAVLCFTLARGVLASAVYFIGADFLLTAAVLSYFILLLRCLRNPGLRNGFMLGAAHGLAFLAKAFAMPWLALSTLLAVSVVNRHKPSRAIAFLLAAMFLPLLCWTSWGMLLKTRYGHFTAGYQSTWNLLPDQSKNGADKGALSFLADKSRSTDEYMVVDNMYPSSPLWNAHLELRGLAPQIFNKEKHNLPQALKQLLILLTPGGILALFFSFQHLFEKAGNPEKTWVVVAACSSVTLVLSYCMLVFDARYLLPLVPLLIALSSSFLLPSESLLHSKLLRVLPLTLLVLGLLYGNLYHASPFRHLRRDYQTDIYSLAASLQQLPRCDRLIAMGTGADPEHGAGWEAGIYAAYFAQCRIVGFSDRLPSAENIAAVLTDAAALHANSMIIVENAASEKNSALLNALQSKSTFPQATSIRDSAGREIGFVLSR